VAAGRCPRVAAAPVVARSRRREQAELPSRRTRSCCVLVIGWSDCPLLVLAILFIDRHEDCSSANSDRQLPRRARRRRSLPSASTA
jgi:hypothetical protein